jgi:hypothetical protein
MAVVVTWRQDSVDARLEQEPVDARLEAEGFA